MNGILLIDKPESWTSNDVVQKLRGILHEKRIGHAGTLDPMATGLLTVFVGRATRAVEFAEGDRKRYLAGLRLGLTTDTQDITGEVLGQCEADVTREALEEALQAFRGELRQTPPMYSAVKVNGRRLYELARKGETVERKEREITVYSLEVLEQNGEDWLLDVSCSKGTYVRTLCHDRGSAGLRRLPFLSAADRGRAFLGGERPYRGRGGGVGGRRSGGRAAAADGFAVSGASRRHARGKGRGARPKRQLFPSGQSGRLLPPVRRQRRVSGAGQGRRRHLPHDQELF